MVKTAPKELMCQLESTLKQLVSVMSDNYNLDFPFIFTNIYIYDAFWRLVVSHIKA